VPNLPEQGGVPHGAEIAIGFVAVQKSKARARLLIRLRIGGFLHSVDRYAVSVSLHTECMCGFRKAGCIPHSSGQGTQTRQAAPKVSRCAAVPACAGRAMRRDIRLWSVYFMTGVRFPSF
jgi:hypothetical protein